MGIAPHSLRAVPAEHLINMVNVFSQINPNGPVHIHIAEQQKEIKDCLAHKGQRPVAWLLENLPVDKHWCLVHATHMDSSECQNLALSGAVAGLCPTTEANLGDGPFNGPVFLEYGGNFGIGSDSNIRISLTEELRTLEYSQRLRDLERNVLASDKESTGSLLYLGAARGGARALGRNAGEIRDGALADLVAIDRSSAGLCALHDDQLLDGLAFAAGDNVITDVWSAGRHMVQDGRHVARDRILRDYRKTVSRLLKEL